MDNNHSGPDGVTSHGRWLYAGDGNSTLKVIDLDAPPMAALQQSISTGGTTRVDEMALTTEGDLLFAANNAEDPPFGTLFAANGDDEDHDNFFDDPGHHAKSHVKIITKVTVDPAIIPAHFGLSFEQPAWDPKTRRFLVSIPIIANNPTGCNYGQLAGPITCNGGVIVINPETLSKPNAVVGAFDAASTIPGSTCAAASQQTPVLGVIDAEANSLIEKVPQSSGSHSVAGGFQLNRIFVPQVAPVAIVGSGGDTTTVGAGICGTNNGCIAVYKHHVPGHDGDERSRS